MIKEKKPTSHGFAKHAVEMDAYLTSLIIVSREKCAEKQQQL